MLRFLEKLGLRSKKKSDDSSELNSIRQTIASAVIWDWPENEPIRVEKALELYPELADCNRSLLEIAIEEFAGRRNTSDEVTATSFADQFPEFRTELLDALAVDQFLSEYSELFDDILRTSNTAEEIDWPTVGEEIAGFHLKDNLGSGGFSRVFLAEDLAYPDRLVAVKFCSNDTHEATALANLNHNAIGVVYSVQRIEERNLSAICMAFKTRTTLHRVGRKVWSNRRPTKTDLVWKEVATANKLKQKSTPEWAKQSFVTWVMDISAELARGLNASHEMDIIHCDMKPSNIMIDRDGRPTLVDFNVAFQKDAFKSPGNIGGTLPYMSPEQIRAFAGQGYSDVGPLTDVYGLGATMYELLTGKMPFGPVPTADDGLRILLEMRKEKPESIRKYNPSVDPDLERLVMSCLAYEMSARPVSAQVVADELDFIRKRTMVRGMPSDWLGTRGLLGTTAVIALLMLAAIGPFGQENRDAGTTKVEAPTPGNHLTVPKKTNAELAVEKTDAAYTALEAQETEKAVELFEQARELDSRHEGAQLGYVRALVAAREFRAASKELNALVEKKTRIPEIDAMHSYCLALNREYKQALDYDDRARAQGLRTPELMSNRAYMLTQSRRAKEGVVIANQALQQMGRPSRANLVVAISTLKSDKTRKTWDAEVLTNLMSGAPDSAAKYQLFAFVNVSLAIKAKLKMDDVAYEKFSELAVNTLLHGTREFGVPDTFYTNIKKSLLSPRQIQRVQDEGLFPNASDQLIEMGSDPSPYLFDPIQGSKYARACQRKLKDIQ